MKARSTVFFVLLALLAVGFGVYGTTIANAEKGLEGEIPMGAVWSLTGDAAVYGSSQKNASILAVDEINKSGMLGTAKIKLITEDDRSTKEGAIAAFDNLIKKNKVIAILGPTLSNSAKASNPIAQESKVIVLGVSNTAGGIVEIGDFIFRDSLPESAVQPNTIQMTMDKLGYKKVAVMYGDDDVFTKGGYDVFKKVLEEKGIQVLTTETFKRKDTDFSAQLTKIKGLNPEQIIVSALAEEAAGIMTQGRQLGIPESVHFIGGNGFNSPKLAQLAGPFAEGAISGAAWFIGNDTPGNKAFVEAYKARYGSNPDQFAAQAYAGVYILAHAIKTAGSADSKAVRDVLAKIKDLDTVLGKFSMNEKRDPVHSPVVQIIKNGKFELFQ
ncbi:ABC transporter substrate-binding protein [Desulfomonile tiedjei]|uniref:Amino acid/amide ABC transporter substrate-binding protein, HAAT family n=1 Tax=Desulfomonile tiedjei (strain ATCC 49306 / DSM 6799 / DCB-1) TaxID=706587 RepID=I4CEY5_DESTA|nr:ABC transporter substrate-binding protein [Desulfomonile tiedjei]AFM28126.1 amino acid/amide ABC transporter substrate-binding protein, HAAT family [Desulfomonile tiedjei DSM 6799]